MCLFAKMSGLKCRQIDLEVGSFQVGHGAEVCKRAKAASHSLCQLEEAVDGFNESICEAGFHEGDDAIPVLAEGFGNFLK